jgi:lysophospholipase L1-like esterase
MPVIVAFGDSNTWGYDPATGGHIRARSDGRASCSVS